MTVSSLPPLFPPGLTADIHQARSEAPARFWVGHAKLPNM